MSKAAAFTIKLDSELRAQFLAAAEQSQRPAAQVMHELMHDFVQRQQDRQKHSAFLRDKVEAARASADAGLGRSDATVEADFAARRARITDRA